MQTVQTMTVDGQEALFIPAGGGQAIQLNQQPGQQIQLGQGQQIQIGPGGSIQLGGGQVQLANNQVLGQVFTVPKSEQPTFISPQGQIQLGQSHPQTFMTPSGQFLRAPTNLMTASNFPQTVQLPNGQSVQVAASPGMSQVLQFPMATTQTIPVQVPISLGNGQTVYQTVHVPIQLHSPSIQQLLQPQMQIIPQMPQLANVITPTGQIQQIQLTPISSLSLQTSQNHINTPATTTVASHPSITSTVSTVSTAAQQPESCQAQTQQMGLQSPNASQTQVNTSQHSLQSPQQISIASPTGQQTISVLPTSQMRTASVQNVIQMPGTSNTSIAHQGTTGIPVQHIPGIGSVQIIPANVLNTASISTANTATSSTPSINGLQNITLTPVSTGQTVQVKQGEQNQLKFLIKQESTGPQGQQVFATIPKSEPSFQGATFINTTPTTQSLTTNETSTTPAQINISVVDTSNLNSSSTGATAGSGSTSDDTKFKKEKKRVACTCPNCVQGERHADRKKQHICHIANCNKVYGKTSHLRAHLRWHTGRKDNFKVD